MRVLIEIGEATELFMLEEVAGRGAAILTSGRSRCRTSGGDGGECGLVVALEF